MDVMRQPGADIGREIATGERADSELDAFISRRDTKRRRDEGERQVEEMWKARSRLEEGRRRDEVDAAWHEHLIRQSAMYARLSAEAAARAARTATGRRLAGYAA